MVNININANGNLLDDATVAVKWLLLVKLLSLLLYQNKILNQDDQAVVKVRPFYSWLPCKSHRRPQTSSSIK